VGERLPTEEELQIELDVSRTVIREAIKVLSDKGLVMTRTRRGTRVQPTNEWNLLDPDMLRWQYENEPSRELLMNLIEVRRSIEVTAAELAAVRATNQEIQLIQDRYRDLADSVEDVEAYIEADLKFHEAICGACGNMLIEQLATTLRVALQSSRKLTVQIPDSSNDALPLHYAIVEAISEHDEESARQATHKLIDRSLEDIERSLLM